MVVTSAHQTRRAMSAALNTALFQPLTIRQRNLMGLARSGV